MITFELTYETTLLDDGQINVRVYPSSEEISKYIASYLTITSKQDMMSIIADFIELMTPLMFNDFKQMENIPQSIRDNYII